MADPQGLPGIYGPQGPDPIDRHVVIHNFVNNNLLCKAQHIDFHCSIHTVLVYGFSDMNVVSTALGG